VDQELGRMQSKSNHVFAVCARTHGFTWRGAVLALLFALATPFAYAILRPIIIAVAGFPLLSQVVQPTKPSFEAASIKPSKPGTRAYVSSIGDRFVATGYTLRMLLIRAYADRPVLKNQIIGGPSWIDTDVFDIEPKGDGHPIPPREMQLRLQALLEDRFQLQLHPENREMPVFSLVISKSGQKVKRSTDQTPPDPRANTSEPALRRNDPNYVPDLPRGQFGMRNTPSGMVLTGTAIPISTFANLLQAQVDRPVLDKSGLTGLFDLRLKFTPSPLSTNEGVTGQNAASSIEPIGPSLFSALENQLGLRLESAKGSIEVFVIDRVQKPSQN